MDARELINVLMSAKKVEEVKAALNEFKKNPGVAEHIFGDRPNNRGVIEVAADAARSMMERVTNAHDALLEQEYLKHSGMPECKTPREAAAAWLGVPLKEGLAGLSTRERQDLAAKTVIKLEPGEGWQSRVLTVIDRGTGIPANKMKDTILSLNESNKIEKHYLAGTYGQGGSSTLAFSTYAFIASRHSQSTKIAFTLVRFEDLPAEKYKTGRYVYLVQDGSVLEVEAKSADMPAGTIIRHFGYDFTNYNSSIGPKSVYGALQRIMFDPVAPVRFENDVAGWKRTIKGSRNALNGATDVGDEHPAKGPSLDHHIPMFNVSLGDHGKIGIEYWVLSRPESKDGKKPGRPSRSFVDDAKPIIFSHNGQNQGELSGRLIKKEAELPFLQVQGRLIVHVSCDRLSPTAKRLLFASTREQTKEGFIQNAIQSEIVELLRSDDELRRLNDTAREESLKDKDDSAKKNIQKQVAKLLRLQGVAMIEGGGEGKTDATSTQTKRRGSSGPRPKPEPIETKEPPTFIRIVSDKDEPIRFYAGQRRYIRIETDANSHYHDPDDPMKSKLNIAVGDDLKVFGTSPLTGGRMRIGVQCKTEVALESKGGIRIELYRPGQSALSDERMYEVISSPKPKSSEMRPFPQIEWIEVEGPEDENWQYIVESGDDNDINRHASNSQMNGGVLFIYYNTMFPRYTMERSKLALSNPSLVESLRRRYELWLAVHALLMNEDQKDSEVGDELVVEELARQERCRLATIAAMVAAQEVKSGINTEDLEEVA